METLATVLITHIYLLAVRDNYMNINDEKKSVNIKC